jgi:hypothetical protein
MNKYEYALTLTASLWKYVVFTSTGGNSVLEIVLIEGQAYTLINSLSITKTSEEEGLVFTRLDSLSVADIQKNVTRKEVYFTTFRFDSTGLDLINVPAP